MRELSDHLPADAQVSLDVGSVVYWYARHLRLPARRAGAPVLDARLDGQRPALRDRREAGRARAGPLVALAGDGAMQMNGLAELITVAHRWREWDDPRFVVCVLSNGDLAEVTWEQRETEGEPRYDASQSLPAFPYARYAELLGLRGILLDEPAQIGQAWSDAFAADRPVVIEALVDADTPLLPPFPVGEEKLESMRRGLELEGPAGDHARDLLETHAALEADRATHGEEPT